MGPVAEAVSRAIRNGEIDSTYRFIEGIAAKAAFERQGANLHEMIKADTRDALAMGVHTRGWLKARELRYSSELLTAEERARNGASWKHDGWRGL